MYFCHKYKQQTTLRYNGKRTTSYDYTELGGG